MRPLNTIWPSRDHPTLEGFLETTALISDVDSVDGASERVTLMTLHAAKGLEFPIVYLVGVEQRLLPYERASAVRLTRGNTKRSGD